MRSLLGLLVACAAVFGVRPLAGQVPAGSADQTTLSPGDSVRIVVFRQPEYSGDFVIAPDGSITHPLLRQVKVAGIPLTTAEANVRQYLSSLFKDPQFVMEPLLRVSVSGEVTHPAVFAVQPETPLVQALARAGGTTREADRHRVRLLRTDRGGAQRILYFNLEDPLDRMAQSPIRSGDQIVVDRKINFFRDRLLPAIGIIGSVASVGLLIDRISNHN